MDLNVVDIPRDVPLWNETRWCGCWSPEEGVGVYMHGGRFRRDLDMWWCQVVAYLPGDELCVERIWGLNGAEAGVRMGGLDLAMTQTGWTAAFDGVGQLTSIAGLSRGTRGSSAPSRRFGWEITARPAAPVWDMYAGAAQDALLHGDTHIQQGYRTTGTLTLDGRSWSLDGVGFKDHSSGPRTIEAWTSHRFVLVVTDQWVLHAGMFDAPDGSPGPAFGVLLRDGEQHKVTRFVMPQAEDTCGGPRTGRLEVEIATGETLRFDAEMLSTLPMLVTDENDNINGIDWDHPGNPVVLFEGKARLTAPDGTVAYGFWERSRRRDALRRVA